MWSINRILPMLLVGIIFQLLLASVHGHSQRRSPISYVSLVENPVIHTPSQRIHSNSVFDITFTLHQGKEHIRLSLEPNHDMVPKGATIEYHDEDGTVRTEMVQRHEIKVFKGEAWVRNAMADGWKHAGWARIVVQSDGVNPLFTGAFVLNNNAHHVQLKSWYLKTKHVEDPELEITGDEHMIVFRDSDVKSARVPASQSPLGTRSLVEKKVQCLADNLTANAIHQEELFHNFQNFMPTSPKPNSLLDGFGLDNLFKRAALDKRQRLDDNGGGNSGGVNLRNNIGQTNGCPTTKMLALVGVAADCTYRSEFQDESLARQHIISMFNSASIVFESSFNISLGIQTMVIQQPNCPGTAPASSPWNLPCTNPAVIGDRLNLFSQWRGTRSEDGNAFWTLLTTCETGNAVGLAWVGMLCRSAVEKGQNNQYVSSTNVVAKSPTEWKVIAHEIGHTMGAVHDCDDEGCGAGLDATSMCCPLSSRTCDAGGNFLMNPSTDDKIERFSACTIGNICGAFLTRSVSKLCLTNNRDVTIITENRCGNGIVEQGEECDCGGVEGCAGNKCCNPSTCEFINNAVCDDANDDCCTSCQYSPSTRVCRASTGECDPEERCTGIAPICPKDDVRPDGTGCSGGLKCASGQCTSRDQQCQTIMGAEYGNNDTSSCNQRSCQVECASPDLGRGRCYAMQQNFLDGTPCEGDGKCRSGQCRGSTTLGEIKDWISKNKNLVIGVCVGVGVLLVICILVCITNSCRRRSRVRKLPPPQLVPQMIPARSQSYPRNQGYQQGQNAAYYGGGGGPSGPQQSGQTGPHMPPIPPTGPYFTRQTSERYG
ncbi:Metallo-peptidase family M12-domain-containing protein [Peziza echinospora]|nr:Metallo-peptidase family M12-domain-containing protein [Peziza echinospora]